MDHGRIPMRHDRPSGGGGPTGRLALVLPGGGARAAYQVGVLKAIARIVPRGGPVPFPIITGTSAGAINAAALAGHADRFTRGVAALESVWAGFHADQVYRTDAWTTLRSSLHWLAAILFGGLGRHNPHSLLDNRPLYELLSRRIPLERIQSHLDEGRLSAVAVTASSYGAGRSVSFFQAVPELTEWRRNRREGRRATLRPEHLMASAAVPMIFPAARVGDEYFGDGAIRQLTPLSPAIHLGASRLLVVGVRDERASAPGVPANGRPSLGQIAGYMLDTLFMDGLYGDLERVTRLNLMLERLPAGARTGLLAGFRRLETLVILPSRDIREIAEAYAAELPRSVRTLLRGVGARGHAGGQLVSYLLFERGYTRALIRLGFDDAMRRREHIRAWLTGEPVPALDAPASVAEDLSGEQQGPQAEEGHETDDVGDGGQHHAAGEGRIHS